MTNLYHIFGLDIESAVSLPSTPVSGHFSRCLPDVVIEYGTRISSVAKSVANNVKFNIEKMVGVPVSEVNVHVGGLRVSDTD